MRNGNTTEQTGQGSAWGVQTHLHSVTHCCPPNAFGKHSRNVSSDRPDRSSGPLAPGKRDRVRERMREGGGGVLERGGEVEREMQRMRESENEDSWTDSSNSSGLTVNSHYEALRRGKVRTGSSRPRRHVRARHRSSRSLTRNSCREECDGGSLACGGGSLSFPRQRGAQRHRSAAVGREDTSRKCKLKILYSNPVRFTERNGSHHQPTYLSERSHHTACTHSMTNGCGRATRTRGEIDWVDS